MKIRVNANKTLEKIKPMHATGGGPGEYHPYLIEDVNAIYREIGIPSARLHDITGAYASNQYIDVHCIFPDFDADENDENNYNFYHSDEYILAIYNVGSEVFYRLGETIDHYHKKLFVLPPKDFSKWARICEHIIRHYNEGWADGYHLGIKHWEIWNEPEGRKNMWTGTDEQFYELYTVAAKHLKSCFPDLMIGGYSCVGLYAVIRDHSHEKYRAWFDTIPPIMDGFFEHIKKNNAPLDFFSWHIYAISPEEVSAAARYVRGYLDERGYTDTASYLTEFNYDYSLRSKPTLYEHPEFTSDVLAALIEGQNSPVDMIFYYDFRKGAYNGMFYVDPLHKEIKRHAAFTAMKFFGDIYRLENRLEVDYECGKGVYALAAGKDGKYGLAIATREFEGKIDIYIDAESVTITEQNGNGIARERKVSVAGGVLSIDTLKESVYYLAF
ncbi:MAG: hypothetical protein IKA64_03065 [Clostridia bacterium]|nr:hypothetical protein [Clostridia bacterium]